MTFDHDFCYSFSFSSPASFFVREKKRGKENQSRGQKSCLSARSLLGLEQQNMCGTLNMMYVPTHSLLLPREEILRLVHSFPLKYILSILTFPSRATYKSEKRASFTTLYHFLNPPSVNVIWSNIYFIIALSE